MALNIPSNPKQLEERSLTDLARELPETANPFLQESWMGAQAIANARRTFEFYKQLRILELEAIPVTAEEKLELWASVWGITLLPATQASGKVVATGIAGSVIPVGTQLNSSDGNAYNVTAEAEIILNVINVASLTSAGLTATAQLAANASMFSGLQVTIAGANEPQYNGTFPVTPTDTDEFEYTLPSAAASPATGTITATFTAAAVNVQSVGFGNNQNLLANTRLTFITPILGVDAAAFVDFGAVGGGTDQESLESLRARMLDRIQNPVALFNVAAIVNQAKQVPGVTDVFVYEITPAVGQVTIYFVRGNDSNPIPEPSEVATVKQKILEIKPAHTDDADVIVLAPTPVNTAFVFSSLVPNTSTMKAAITAQLQALFRDLATVGVALTENQYKYAIQSTIDPQTGALVQSFALSSPSGDIGGGADEYPVLTTVTFP